MSECLGQLVCSVFAEMNRCVLCVAGLAVAPCDAVANGRFPFLVTSQTGKTLVCKTRREAKRNEWIDRLRTASSNLEVPDRSQDGSVCFISVPLAETQTPGGASERKAQVAATWSTRWSKTMQQFYHRAEPDEVGSLWSRYKQSEWIACDAVP